MRIRQAIVGLIVLSGMVSSPVRGDLVYFVRGGQVQLPTRLEGSTVWLESPDGPKPFPIGEIQAIVPEPSDESQWSRLQDEARKKAQPEPRFEAVWWALEHGLATQATHFLAESPPNDPGHGPTRRSLDALKTLKAPCPEPALEPLRVRLRPSRFRELRGPHVVLLHQLSEAEARERLDLLERVIVTFHLIHAARGIELTPLRERLVSVEFAEHRDYVTFLRKIEAEAFVDTQGYYQPTLGVVFTFNTRSVEAHRSSRRAIANRSKSGESESEIRRRTLLLDLDWRAHDQGILAHETFHQLSAATGLAPRFDDFPQWLHEGLAAQFEVVRGGRWAGVGRAHDLRLPDWRAIQPKPRLAPLLLDEGMSHGYQRDRYAASWGLVYFLRKTRPSSFQTFLDLLRAPSVDATNRPGRSAQAFQAAFGGDLEALERDWHRFLEETKTPLEAGRPDPSRR